jgi:hypothetical protein
MDESQRSLILPSSIFLYLEYITGPGQKRTAYFVPPETFMGGMNIQITLKKIRGIGTNILQLLAEPGNGFGMIIFIGVRGMLPNPCISSGSNIFKEFLFNALRDSPNNPNPLSILGITNPNDIDFTFIISQTAPPFLELSKDNFNNGGIDKRVYGSVLLDGPEVYELIDKNLTFKNDILLVSNSGTTPLDENYMSIIGPLKTYRNYGNNDDNDDYNPKKIGKRGKRGGKSKKSRRLKKSNRHKRRITRRRKY